MQLPNSMMPMFSEFLEQSIGAKDTTSEREEGMGRRRFFNPHSGGLLVLTNSIPDSEVFSVNVIPPSEEDNILGSWKLYVSAQTIQAAKASS